MIETDPLAAAVQHYAMTEAHQVRDQSGRLKPLTRQRLDSLISTAVHFDQPDLAAALLILALASERPGGAERCLTALKHAAADLDLELLELPVTSCQLPVEEKKGG